MNIESIVDFATSPATAEHYRPAPEKILKGDPEQSVRNHYGSPCGQFNVGIWEGAVGQWTVNYTEHEYCEILQASPSSATPPAAPRPCARATAS